MLGDINDEIRDTYGYLRNLIEETKNLHDLYRIAHPTLSEILTVTADALRDQLAAKLRLEFKLEHRFSERNFTGDVFCPSCETTVDSRHNYDDPAWQAEADRLLKGD